MIEDERQDMIHVILLDELKCDIFFMLSDQSSEMR
jgi:hypothetical protein